MAETDTELASTTSPTDGPTGTPRDAPAPTSEAARPARSGGAGRWAGWAALLLVVLLAIYFVRWTERTGRELSRRVHEGELKMAQAETKVSQAQDLMRDLQSRAAVAEAKLGEVLGQQAQLELLYRAVTEDTIEAMLADVESSIALAAQQLAAAGNPQGPLIALQGAENRLARGNDVRLAPLRAAIARDMERLRAASGGDAAALAIRLDALLGNIDALPLLAAGASSAAESTQPARPDRAGVGASATSWYRRMFSLEALRAELAQMVRVRRIDTPDAALIAPEQAYFLRENLRLQLLNARLTLLARSDTLFRNDLERAIGWLRAYYDLEDRQVVATIEQLRQLRAARAAGEIPTVSESLAAVRSARGVRDPKR